MDLEEIGISAGDWVDSAQDRNYWRALVNATLNLRVPYAMELLTYTLELGQHFLYFPVFSYNNTFLQSDTVIAFHMSFNS